MNFTFYRPGFGIFLGIQETHLHELLDAYFDPLDSGEVATINFWWLSVAGPRKMGKICVLPISEFYSASLTLTRIVIGRNHSALVSLKGQLSIHLLILLNQREIRKIYFRRKNGKTLFLFS
jgi:hypothetical protein